jgi:hypothetical protein
MTDHYKSDRRQFLKLIALGSISGTLGLPITACSKRKFLNPDEDVYLSGGSYDNQGTRAYALIAINTNQKKEHVIPCDFLPHEIILHPEDSYTVFCFEKDGPNACTVDLKNDRVINRFQAAGNHHFSGHAVFDGNGRLFTIEIEQLTKQGKISIRDASTLDIIKQLPTLGLSPHDCQLNENTLAVSNTGQDATGFHQPSLVFIDIESEKLLSRLKLDDDELNAGHFYMAYENKLVIASAPLDQSDSKAVGGVSIQDNEHSVITMTHPEDLSGRLKGEALGITVSPEHEVAAITHPDANLLTFWSLKDSPGNASFIKAIDIDNPRGVTQTLDGKSFMISYGRNPAMVNIEISSLTRQAETIMSPTSVTGEHLLNWSASLREMI